jgi:hypothetical protein
MEFIHDHIAICDISKNLDFDKIFYCFDKIDDKFLSVGHRTQLTMKIDFYAEKIESEEQSYLKEVVKNKVHPLVYNFMEKVGIDKNSYSHFPNILSSKMIPGTDMDSHYDPEDAVIYLLYLNDGFNGGALVFDDLNIEFNPTAGKLFMFYSKYKHHVTMLSGKERYTLSSGFAPKEYLVDYAPSP